MTAKQSMLIGLVTMIGNLVIDQLSPELRKTIVVAIAELKVRAVATKNPFDDIAVALLERLFSQWIK